jgi:hypothetical protein
MPLDLCTSVTPTTLPKAPTLPNQYFTIDATFKRLLGWIDEYGRLFPPPSGKHLRYKVVGPELTWPGNARHWFATVLAHSRWQPQTPIFEIGADEEEGSCSVRLTCLDPNREGWYRAMIDFLVPDDAAGDAARDVYPLPALPEPGATPAPAQPPQPVERDAPHVPKRPADLRRWKAAWQRIKPLVAQGKSNDYIVGWLARHDDDLQLSKESIIRIIAAGEESLLD